MDLKLNGDDIPVTYDSRHEYAARFPDFALNCLGLGFNYCAQVDLYCRWLLDTSTERHFKLLSQGSPF